MISTFKGHVVYDPLNELRTKLEMIAKCRYHFVFVRDSLIRVQIVFQSVLSSEVLSLWTNMYQPSSRAWQERSGRKDGTICSFMDVISVLSWSHFRDYDR